PDNIGFSGPGKSQSDINSAVSTGITIHLESKSEFQRVLAASQSSGKQAKVAIRINPDFELKSSGLKMSGGANPFGVDEELAPELINTIQQSDVDFRGFHVFTGSQNLNTENIIQAQDKTINLMIRLSEIAGGIPDLINIGGGFGIPYFAGDSALDIQAISNNLTKNLSLLRQHRDDSQITLELGRYLIGASGYYICQVIEKKISRKKTFIVVNGGMHHHLAASGNLGQIIRKNYPICVGNNLTSDKTEKVTIVGPLCTPLDILADEIELPVINEGDSIVVFQSGAYGFSASPQLFLSHIAPKELIIGNGAIYV
ncbi:MAG: pyridoxal-dependent decarboxylase, exosortase A system-associated, partial [Gammaproteobacteria bacterium]